MQVRAPWVLQITFSGCGEGEEFVVIGEACGHSAELWRSRLLVSTHRSPLKRYGRPGAGIAGVAPLKCWCAATASSPPVADAVRHPRVTSAEKKIRQ